MIPSICRAIKNVRGFRTFATYNGKDLYFPKYGCSLYEYQDDPVVRRKFFTADLTTDEGPKKELDTVETALYTTEEREKALALRELMCELENRIEYDEEFGSGHPANVKKREEMKKKEPWEPPLEAPYSARED